LNNKVEVVRHDDDSQNPEIRRGKGARENIERAGPNRGREPSL